MTESAESKDRWDKLEVVLRPVGGLVTGVVIAFLGFLTQGYLSERNAEDRRAQLYTELMSRREQSASDLRSAMFRSIIDTFLVEDPGQAPSLEQEILHLELLVRNFHESLDLAPLFDHLNRRVQRAEHVRREERQDYLARLRGLASEITSKQTLALSSRGAAMESVFGYACPESCDDCDLQAEDAKDVIAEETLTVEGIPRTYTLWLREVDPSKESLKLRLRVESPGAVADRTIKEAEFWVSPFDFPMIDNTRLPGGQRVAVVLQSLSLADPEAGRERCREGLAHLRVVAFPGEYGSLKERLFIQDIIDEMLAEDPPSRRNGAG